MESGVPTLAIMLPTAWAEYLATIEDPFTGRRVPNAIPPGQWDANVYGGRHLRRLGHRVAWQDLPRV